MTENEFLLQDRVQKIQQVIGAELYELAHQYISQLLYGVHIAGVAVIAVPKFVAGQQFGQMVVADVIYTKVNDTPYDFMQ